jgi:GDP-L-fucose synthase
MLLVQAQAYRGEYGTNAICLFPVYLYGPGDNFDEETRHVIPVMIRKFVEAEELGLRSVTLWGDGSRAREFLYVIDGAHAFRLALENYDQPEPLNIGSGDETSIRDLAERIRAAVGFAEIFPNRQRRHSSLSMLTPLEFEARHQPTTAA